MDDSILVILFVPLFALFVRAVLALVTYLEQFRAQDTKATDVVRKKRPAPRLRATDHVDDGKKHLLLCATGSVATIKIPSIIQALSSHTNLSIRVILSKSAGEFLQGQSDEQPSIETIASYKNVDGIYFDEDEWSKPWVRGDNILHIEIRRWADLMAVVPLSANALAKLSLGMSNDLVSSVARAWDTTGMIDMPRAGSKHTSAGKKLLLVAPAMNTAMWEHPITKQHISSLEQWSVANDGWIEIVSPIQKTLACGDTGSGAMKDWKEITRIIEERLMLVEDDDHVLI